MNHVVVTLTTSNYDYLHKKHRVWNSYCVAEQSMCHLVTKNYGKLTFILHHFQKTCEYEYVSSL